MLHPKIEQARIASNILKSYNGVEKLTTPTISQIEFEKSVIEDKIPFYLDEVIKSWSKDMSVKLEKEADVIAKSELSKSITSQVNNLAKIDIVFNGAVKTVWADVVDSTTNSYRDNSLTRKLNLSGKAVS